MIDPEWRNPPLNLTLMHDEIHLWLCEINGLKDCSNTFEKSLSIDELEKANKFVFGKDKLSYIISRGTLRKILSKYLNVSPKLIQFGYNQYGKPFIHFPEKGRLKFNLSHSNEYCLIAINKEMETGVDIEWINKDLEPNDIAHNYFSAQELSNFKSIDKGNQLEAFYKIWTRKEAFIKAIGKGLSIPLDSFDVTIDDFKPKIKRIDGEKNISKYQLQNLKISNNYCAALIYIGQKKHSKMFFIENASQLISCKFIYHSDP